MNPNTNRSMLFGVVGGYLIYLAYDLLKSYRAGEPSSMPDALRIVFMIFFAAAGAGLILFAWRTWQKGREGREEDRIEIGDGDGDGGDKP